MADAARTVGDQAITQSLPQLREERRQEAKARSSRSRVRRVASWFVSPDSRAVVYLGLLVIVAGFGLIAFTWSQVAATLSVGLQLPYLASGGFIGLGLVVVGVGIISIGVKRRDNFNRLRQIQKLSATMESIEKAVTDAPADSDVQRPAADDRY